LEQHLLPAILQQLASGQDTKGGSMPMGPLPASPSLSASPAAALPTPDGPPALHACKACHRAKVHCADGPDGQRRPCARCLRLGVRCDEDTKAIKRSCVRCHASKVKCDRDLRDPCGRCLRLGLTCVEHIVPVGCRTKRSARKNRLEPVGQSAAGVLAAFKARPPSL